MEMFISFFTGKVMLFYGITLIMKEKSNASALVWEQMRPSLGADASESGSRCVRVWEQMQLRLGPDAVTHGPRRSCAWSQTHLNAGQRSLTDIEDGAVSHIWQKLICRRARQMLTLHQAKRIHEDRKR